MMTAERDQLIAELDTLVEYEDAAQWNRAVKICERLADIGWGSRERVDAIAVKTGKDIITKLVNQHDDCRFRMARWKRRPHGFEQVRAEYRHSPDRPSVPTQDRWRYRVGKRFVIVDVPALLSQSNPWIQMPFSFGGVFSAGHAGFEHGRSFRKVLLSHLRQNEYGAALEVFSISMRSPARFGLKIGRYDAKRKRFLCKLALTEGYGELSTDEQKAFFAEAVHEAFVALKDKMLKAKVSYDLAAFERDLSHALRAWLTR